MLYKRGRRVLAICLFVLALTVLAAMWAPVKVTA
jgi:hypothetical protein